MRQKRGKRVVHIVDKLKERGGNLRVMEGGTDKNRQGLSLSRISRLISVEGLIIASLILFKNK